MDLLSASKMASSGSSPSKPYLSPYQAHFQFLPFGKNWFYECQHLCPMKKIMLILIAASTLFAVQAQNSPTNEKGFFDVQINPAYPFLGGFGAKGYYNFPKRWSVGLVAEGAFTLPEFAQRSFFTNHDNMDIRWDYAIGTEVRYRFRRKDNDIKGFYALAGAGYEQWSVTPESEQPRLPNTVQEEQFTNFYTVFGVGYNWMPFRKRGFYVGASYGWIFILNNTDERSVNGQRFNLRTNIPPSFTPNLAIGWRF